METQILSEIISTCGLSGWRRASGLISELQHLDQQPNEVIYNSLANGCAQGLTWRRALSFAGHLMAFNSSMSACRWPKRCFIKPLAMR